MPPQWFRRNWLARCDCSLAKRLILFLAKMKFGQKVRFPYLYPSRCYRIIYNAWVDAPRISRRKRSWPRPIVWVILAFMLWCCTSRDHYFECQSYVSIVVVRRLLGSVPSPSTWRMLFILVTLVAFIVVLLFQCSMHPAGTCASFSFIMSFRVLSFYL